MPRNLSALQQNVQAKRRNLFQADARKDPGPMMPPGAAMALSGPSAPQEGILSGFLNAILGLLGGDADGGSVVDTSVGDVPGVEDSTPQKKTHEPVRRPVHRNP